jgi:type IX secretion system PorP/SprF family membrane protein
MMKFIKLTIVLVALHFFANNANAQYRETFYTTLLNPFIANPAVAGTSGAPFAMFNARTLVGGASSSARTINFSVHTPLNNVPKYGNSSVGLKFISHNAGVFQTTNAEAAYSVKVDLSRDDHLSLGLSLGFIQTALDKDLLSSNVNLADPNIDAPQLNQFLFTTGAGILYQNRNGLELYAASPMLVSVSEPLSAFALVGASYKFNLGGHSSTNYLKPVINFYNFTNTQKVIDGLLSMYFNDAFKLQLGYRSSGAAVAGLGFNINSFLVAYNYYHFTGEFTRYAPAQNEIAIAFKFKPQRKSGRRGDANYW